jgi:hypothetical protein
MAECCSLSYRQLAWATEWWHEHAGEIEVAVARLIVGERDIAELVGISPADLSWAAGMIAGMVRVRRFQERSPMVSRYAKSSSLVIAIAAVARAPPSPVRRTSWLWRSAAPRSAS